MKLSSTVSLLFPRVVKQKPVRILCVSKVLSMLWLIVMSFLAANIIGVIEAKKLSATFIAADVAQVKLMRLLCVFAIFKADVYAL